MASYPQDWLRAPPMAPSPMVYDFSGFGGFQPLDPAPYGVPRPVRPTVRNLAEKERVRQIEIAERQKALREASEPKTMLPSWSQIRADLQADAAKPTAYAQSRRMAAMDQQDAARAPQMPPDDPNVRPRAPERYGSNMPPAKVPSDVTGALTRRLSNVRRDPERGAADDPRVQPRFTMADLPGARAVEERRLSRSMDAMEQQDAARGNGDPVGVAAAAQRIIYPPNTPRNEGTLGGDIAKIYRGLPTFSNPLIADRGAGTARREAIPDDARVAALAQASAAPVPPGADPDGWVGPGGIRYTKARPDSRDTRNAPPRRIMTVGPDGVARPLVTDPSQRSAPYWGGEDPESSGNQQWRARPDNMIYDPGPWNRGVPSAGATASAPPIPIPKPADLSAVRRVGSPIPGAPMPPVTGDSRLQGIVDPGAAQPGGMAGAELGDQGVAPMTAGQPNAGQAVAAAQDAMDKGFSMDRLMSDPLLRFGLALMASGGKPGASLGGAIGEAGLTTLALGRQDKRDARLDRMEDRKLTQGDEQLKVEREKLTESIKTRLEEIKTRSADKALDVEARKELARERMELQKQMQVAANASREQVAQMMAGMKEGPEERERRSMNEMETRLRTVKTKDQMGNEVPMYDDTKIEELMARNFPSSIRAKAFVQSEAERVARDLKAGKLTREQAEQRLKFLGAE